MEEVDKDWMMTKMVGGSAFLLVPADPGSPGQRAVKRLLLCCCVRDTCIVEKYKLQFVKCPKENR